MHLKLIRDEDGRPVDALHVHGYASLEESDMLEKAIWEALALDVPRPDSLGMLGADKRSAPLAISKLMLLYHLLDLAAGQPEPGS